MTPRPLVAGLAAALIAFSAAAEDATGKWNVSVDTPQGPMALVFDLKAEGSSLTGTMSNDFMGSTPISEGTVEGDDVAFKLTFQGGPNGAMTISYKGKVQGDDLVLTSTFEGGAPPGTPAETTLTAKRAL